MTNASIPLEEVVGSAQPIGDFARNWRARAARWLGAAFERESLTRRFIAAVPYTVLLLFMEYATERWKVSGSVGARVWAGIFHSELLIVAFIFFVPFLIGFFRRHYLAVFSLFYAVCVLDFIAWFTINRPVHIEDLVYGPEMIKDYAEFIGQLGRVLLMKIGILIVAPVFIWAFDRWSRRVKLTDKLAGAMPTTFFGLAIVYTLAFPLVYDARYFGHNSLVRIGSEALYQSKLERLNPDRATVQKLLGAPISSSALLGSSAARHKNVIVFVIETGMAGYYPDLPKTLRENGAGDFAANAFASEEHYTTYPESDRAIFSILVGQYPPLMKGWMTKPNYDRSLAHALEQQGYTTYMVSTGPLEFHDDIVMVRNVGFDRIIQVTRVKKAFQVKNGEVVWDRSKLYAADMELLDSATSVINEHKTENSKPYLLVLAPQSSHAPFEPPPGSDVSPTDDAGLVKANALWQYKLIEELIKKLRATGELENTMLVVTGDHGVRSVYETKQLFGDPSLLHRISFHVPFWILNPGQKSFRNPSWATSHIDVTPTILGMLGVPYLADAYHGRSMMSPTERTVFFFGGEFVSPNGFKRGDRFYMENRLRHLSLARNDFDFGATTSSAFGPGDLSATDVDRALVTIQSFLLH
jgi:hypothetical protein